MKTKEKKHLEVLILDAKGGKELVRLDTEMTAKEMANCIRRSNEARNRRRPTVMEPAFRTGHGYLRENSRSWTLHMRLPKNVEKMFDIMLDELSEMGTWMIWNSIINWKGELR